MWGVLGILSHTPLLLARIMSFCLAEAKANYGQWPLAGYPHARQGRAAGRAQIGYAVIYDWVHENSNSRLFVDDMIRCQYVEGDVWGSVSE